MPASPFGLGLARFALLAHIEIIFADLAIERRAANAETTRHFTHMAFIEVDGILKDIALDIAQRAQLARLVLNGYRAVLAGLNGLSDIGGLVEGR